MIKNESGVASPTKRIQEKESKKNPRKTRRRQKNPDAWFRRRMQKAKNAGKEYQYKNNKGEWVTVPPKTVGKPCTCKAKCFEKFDPEEINEVFKSFWKWVIMIYKTCIYAALLNVRKQKIKKN